MRETVGGVLSAEVMIPNRAEFETVSGAIGDETRASMFGVALSGDSSRSRREESLFATGVDFV